MPKLAHAIIAGTLAVLVFAAGDAVGTATAEPVIPAECAAALDVYREQLGATSLYAEALRLDLPEQRDEQAAIIDGLDPGALETADAGCMSHGVEAGGPAPVEHTHEDGTTHQGADH